MKAKELAEKLLEYPDFEVLVSDRDNEEWDYFSYSSCERKSVDTIGVLSYKDKLFNIITK